MWPVPTEICCKRKIPDFKDFAQKKDYKKNLNSFKTFSACRSENILDTPGYIKYTKAHFYFNGATRKLAFVAHFASAGQCCSKTLSLTCSQQHGNTWDLVKKADPWALPQNC